jgi:predicted nucleotidyltransferase
MLIDEIRAKKSLIDALVKEYGGRHLRVFGSVVSGEETPDSDVDFLIEFPRGYDLLAQRLPLTQQLSDLMNRPVDLIPEHELSPYLREHILREAVEL